MKIHNGSYAQIAEIVDIVAICSGSKLLLCAGRRSINSHSLVVGIQKSLILLVLREREEGQMDGGTVL